MSEFFISSGKILYPIIYLAEKNRYLQKVTNNLPSTLGSMGLLQRNNDGKSAVCLPY